MRFTRQLLLPLFMLAVMMLSSGCVGFFTHMVHDDNQWYSNERNEFTEAYDKAAQAGGYKGRYTGQLKQCEAVYDVYQFPGALKGPGRTLTILLPTKPITPEKGWQVVYSPEKAIVMESVRVKAPIAPAMLISWNSLCSPHKDPRMTGPHVLELFVHDGGGMVKRLDASSGILVKYDLEVQLEWCARSKATQAWKQCRYLCAVPLDIVCLPVTVPYTLFVIAIFREH